MNEQLVRSGHNVPRTHDKFICIHTKTPEKRLMMMHVADWSVKYRLYMTAHTPGY